MSSGMVKLEIRHTKHVVRLKKCVFGSTFLLGLLAVLLSIVSLWRFYPHTFLFDNGAFADTTNVTESMDNIIEKIVKEMQELSELQKDQEILEQRYIKFLTEILSLIGSVRHQIPRMGSTKQYYAEAKLPGGHPLAKGKEETDEAANFFLIEEIRKYIKVKPNRLGKQNFMGANGSFTSVGHACFSMKEELEQYMEYDVGDFCEDDWKLAQRLMVHGCDPLPRRRCFSRSPKFYTKPYPINESIWKLPDDHNVRWDGYKCKHFACLAKNSTGKGFFKCSDCFNLTHHESPRWVEVVYRDPSTNNTPDFLISDVLNIKPGEVRIGLDFSVGTGTFAARMRELNVTIITATINFGAPFSEMIALRGLLPLYLTVNQRLPFFDNTLDLIHTTRFLDGWIDLVVLEFVLYDWDRVLRPGGLLWIDSFFCLEKDLEDYLNEFEMLRYKKRMWVTVAKVDKDGPPEVFFSAVLEKPLRPF